MASVRLDSDAKTDRKSSVQSLSKGLRLLEAVARSDEPLTLSEIARGCRLDAGTCFRMLNTLVDDGYLGRVEGKRFTLTLKILDLGHRAIARRDVRATVRPILRDLVSETSEAASFAVLEGSDVVYVERARAGFTRLGVDIQTGTIVPAQNSVIGRVLLAFRTPSAKDASLATIQRDADLDAVLAGIRKDGHYSAESLLRNGLFVVAAPVLDPDGLSFGAISIAAPLVRAAGPTFAQTTLAALIPAAKSLGRALAAGGIVVP